MPQQAVKYAGLLNATTMDAELAAADLVIEAVVESPEVKKQIYARLEPQLRQGDFGVEHVDDSDHAVGGGIEAAGEFLRDSLFQSGAEDAAGRSDSRKANQRRDGGDGGGVCRNRSESRRSW